VASIQRLAEDEFSSTGNAKNCRFCVYRSLCDRGVRAGSLEDWIGEAEAGPPPEEIKLDFEQIAEIEF